MTSLPARLAKGTNQVHTLEASAAFPRTLADFRVDVKGDVICSIPESQHLFTGNKSLILVGWLSTSKSHSQFLTVFVLNPSFGSSCLLALHYPESWWYWWDQFPKGTGPSFRCPKDKLKYWMSLPIYNFSRKKPKYIGPWKHLQPTIWHGKSPSQSTNAH